MDKNMETILSLCRDPMLALEGRKLLCLNGPAKAIFPDAEPGMSALGILPDFLLFAEEPHFAASVAIDGRDHLVNCALEDGIRLICMVPRSADDVPCFLSDGMMAELSNTLGSADLALDRIAKSMGEMTPEQQRISASLRRSHHSLKRQINNLNMAMRLQSGAAWFFPDEADLVALCADLAASVEAVRAEHMAEVVFSSPLPSLSARVDAQLVERLLLNLLANSLAHTPAGGQIRLRVERSGENAVLSVEDNGEGIPPEIMQNVFIRYECRADRYHLDRTMTAGLGLTIASGIASLHHGALVMESREGEGTSVRVMLPLEQDTTVTLKGSDDPHPEGMEPILTELSGLLGPEAYTEEYLD